jgi:hypothetical protein
MLTNCQANLIIYLGRDIKNAIRINWHAGGGQDYHIRTFNRHPGKDFRCWKDQYCHSRVPDERIDFLSARFKPKKTTYAQLELVDIPGLVPGAEKSAHVFLDAVRKSDALLHVVRLFDSGNAPFIYDSINPLRDIETVSYELLLSDLT